MTSKTHERDKAMPLDGIDTLTSNGPKHVLAWAMKPISYARHRFPPDVIRHAVWLYVRFTLSYRDVEDLLAERDKAAALRLLRPPRVAGGKMRDAPV